MTLPSDWLPTPTEVEEKVARHLCQLRGLDPDKMIKAYSAVLVPEGDRRNYSRTEQIRVPTWRALWTQAVEFLRMYEFVSVLSASGTLSQSEPLQDGERSASELYAEDRNSTSGVGPEDDSTQQGGVSSEEDSESMEGFDDAPVISWTEALGLLSDPDSPS